MRVRIDKAMVQTSETQGMVEFVRCRFQVRRKVLLPRNCSERSHMTPQVTTQTDPPAASGPRINHIPSMLTHVTVAAKLEGGVGSRQSLVGCKQSICFEWVLCTWHGRIEHEATSGDMLSYACVGRYGRQTRVHLLTWHQGVCW